MADKDNSKNMTKAESDCERVKDIIARGGRDSVISFHPWCPKQVFVVVV